MQKNEEKPVITPVEDHTFTIGSILMVSVFLTLLAQHCWEDPILNVMAALAPILIGVASVALHTREDDDGEEETLEAEENARYAVTVSVTGYAGIFIARAMPPQYSWMAVMTFMIMIAYVCFRLVDRHKQKKERSYEKDILEVPVQMSAAQEEEFLEEGARESFYASLIEAQAGRRH